MEDKSSTKINTTPTPTSASVLFDSGQQPSFSTSFNETCLAAIDEGLRTSTGTMLNIVEVLAPKEEEGEFTLFAKLPTEIRLKIWNDALLGRRCIEIHSTTLGREDSEDDDGTKDELEIEIEHKLHRSNIASDVAEDENR